MGGYSDESLVKKMLNAEDRFAQNDAKIGRLEEAVTNLSTQFNQALALVENLAPQLTTMLGSPGGASAPGGNGNNGHGVPPQNSAPQQTTPGQPDFDTAAKALGVTKEQLIALIQQAQGQPAAQAVPQQQGGLLGGSSNGAVATNILDKLVQFYMLSQQSRAQSNPAQDFFNSLQTGFEMLSTMSNFMINMKKSWMEEERLVHKITGKDGSKGSKVAQKESDE